MQNPADKRDRSIDLLKTLAIFGVLTIHTCTLGYQHPVGLSLIHISICVLLPPGAAHKSSTRSPGWASSKAAGAMALGSCR